MRNGFIGSMIAMAVFSITPIPATGQVFTPPRTPNGKPNLQGIWQVLNTAAWDIQDHHAQLGVPAGQGVVEGNKPVPAGGVGEKARELRKRSDH